MAIEIERKFLASKDFSWDTGVAIKQGYISRKGTTTVRVRIHGDRSYLTIKGKTEGISRSGFEYAIPHSDASEMLITLCDKPIIEKVRYTYEDANDQLWVIDVFNGDNIGLILAKIELESEDQKITLPPWIGKEVTGDKRYYNAFLTINPYSKWKKS